MKKNKKINRKLLIISILFATSCSDKNKKDEYIALKDDFFDKISKVKKFENNDKINKSEILEMIKIRNFLSKQE